MQSRHAAMPQEPGKRLPGIPFSGKFQKLRIRQRMDGQLHMTATEPVRQLRGKNPRVRSGHINVGGGGFQKRSDGTLPTRNLLHLVEHQHPWPATELGLNPVVQILARPHLIPVHAFLVDDQDGHMRIPGPNRLGLQLQKRAFAHSAHSCDQFDRRLEGKLIQPLCIFISTMHEYLLNLPFNFDYTIYFIYRYKSL